MPLAVFAVLAWPIAAQAASGGDSNSGDVWVDSVGQPAGPGHEMDPHLPCQDINLWGSGLADSSGMFSIDGWQPSGSQEVDYSGSWSYDQGSGSEVIATINVTTLINQAIANGDTAQAQQGYHFKLEFSQDPSKHKTFWVKCGPPSPPPAPPPPAPPPQPTPSSGQTNSSTPPSPGTCQCKPHRHHKHKKHKKHRHHKHRTVRFTG